VGHDAVIGDGCTISGHCDVTGFASLGEGVFMGTHASVLPRAVVGDSAVIGAGSVVLKKVQPNTTVFGVPAKKISGFGKDH
jgi:serine acetyltransferase